MTARAWSPFQVGLLAVAVALLGVVAVLGFMALEPDQERCTTGFMDFGPDVDRAPEAALAEFVGNNADLYPLDGWTVASVEGSRTTFTNDDGGRFEIEVDRGAVRAFTRCTR